MSAKAETVTERTSPPPDQDQAAIAACQQGDKEAFAILVNNYQKQMFNLAFRMIGSYDDAAEVVQDAFASAFKNIHRYKGSAKFTTWLTRIVINSSKNRIKKLVVEKHKNPVSLDECRHTGDGEIRFDPAADDPSAQEIMERKQIQQQVQWCIGRIEDGFRDVLVLKEIQGFSYAEIGATLKIPQGTVKSKLYRARDSLKTCLKRVFGDLSHVLP
jgi:RNA polymerase sigma-70 factor, ECF subfamily